MVKVDAMTTLQAVQGAVALVLQIEVPADDELLPVDSFARQWIVVHLEDALDIKIGEAAAASWYTVAELTAIVERARA